MKGQGQGEAHRCDADGGEAQVLDRVREHEHQREAEDQRQGKAVDQGLDVARARSQRVAQGAEEQAERREDEEGEGAHRWAAMLRDMAHSSNSAHPGVGDQARVKCATFL